MAALIPLLGSLATRYLANHAPEIAAGGGKILQHGTSKTVPDLFRHLGKLAGTSEGRDKILAGAHTGIGKGANIAREGLGLLNRFGVLGNQATNRHAETVGRIAGGLQHTLGKLSKLKKRFSF